MESTPFDDRSRIRLLALDVDGVLTDGRIYFGSEGTQSKAISFRDIMGLSRARRAGLRLVLISGEDDAMLDAFGAKLQIEDVFRDCKDKAAALRQACERHDLGVEASCYVGDDINDLSAMEIAGVSVAVPNAHDSVLEQADYVTRAPAGAGAVREVTDLILARSFGGKEGD